VFLDERITPVVAFAAALVLAGVELVLFQEDVVTMWWQSRRIVRSVDSV
jgi:hypothetical protein